jgi:hypothetical protein
MPNLGLILITTGTTELDRWAIYRAVGAINTAMPSLWMEEGMTGFALIEPLAIIPRHGFCLAISTFRAGNDRLGN